MKAQYRLVTFLRDGVEYYRVQQRYRYDLHIGDWVELHQSHELSHGYKSEKSAIDAIRQYESKIEYIPRIINVEV